MERNAVHPIAKAILTYAKIQKTPIISLKEFKAIPGFGLQSLITKPDGDIETYIGHPAYILPKLPTQEAEKLRDKAQEIQARGELIAVLLMGQQLFLFRFHDTLRPKIKETIKDIRKRGWRLVMLTGDHVESARRIAEEVGIDEFHADLRPEDKLNYVSRLAQEMGLAMIGDGINDAPSLARATVGICMGQVGSTAAIDASDVVLLHDNIELMDWLIGKAYQTQKIVKQNLFVAVSAILIASIPALGGIIPLWLAVVMHEGGTVLVGLNALRLLRS